MTTMQNKKVSVIVPNYNYARYLEKRIDSILKQTYPIYELIILDDASSDESVKKLESIILKLKSKFPKLKIKFLRNEKNSGKTILQWRKGVEEANGDYIWIAEADDLSRRDFLKTAMEGFSDPKVVLSYVESAVISGRGIIIAPNFRWSRDKEKTGHYKNSYIKNGMDEIREILAIRCTIPNVSAVVFKNDKKLLKYLDEAARFSQVGDWYFYIKILENGKISYNRRPLNLFRVHKKSATKQAEKIIHLNEIKKIHKLINDEYEISENIKQRMVNEEERIKNERI